MLMRKVGRRILKCGSRVPNDAITGELGWMSMRGRRMMLRLSYWGKILAMPDERLVNSVYEGGRALLSGCTCEYVVQSNEELADGAWTPR